MRTAAWISVVVVGLGAAGCARAEPGSSPPPTASSQSASPVPTTSLTPSPSPSPPQSAPPQSAPPPAAADGMDVAACFDGRCEIVLAGRLEIPLDKRFRVSGLTVSIADGESVNVVANGGMLQAGGGVGAQMTLNAIRIEVVAVRNSEAVIRLSPTRG